MVVPAAELELFVRIADAQPHGAGLREIQGRPLDRPKLARGDKIGVHGREAVRVDLKQMPQNVPVPLARQVEVGMVRQVHDRGPVRDCPVIDAQNLLVRPPVSHGYLQVAGELLLAVRTDTREDDAVAGGGRLRLPQHQVKTHLPAMQAVRPVIGDQPVLPAVQIEGRARDAVAVPADGPADETAVGRVSVGRAEPQRDVSLPARAVRHGHGDQRRPEIGENGRASVPVGEFEQFRFHAAGCPAERFPLHESVSSVKIGNDSFRPRRAILRRPGAAQ